MWFCIVVRNIAELVCDSREEQYCKIRALFGNCESEIKADLDFVFRKKYPALSVKSSSSSSTTLLGQNRLNKGYKKEKLN